ncbi:MAG: hypothetical protein HY910_05225 [Desulfarculus sp.]|nr:hypothetical protein [Desulfarculus sp.]
MDHHPAIPGPDGGGQGTWLHRWFWRLLLAAVLLRLLLGVGIFLWSQQANPRQPVEAMAQRLMAPDGLGYHIGAVKVDGYWSDPNPDKVLRHEHMVARFSVLVGALYHLTWPQPLVMTLLNCLCYLGVGLLARDLGRRLGQPPARAAGLALLICLWPSSLAWSALPMKDSPSLFLIFALLSLTLYLARSAGQPWGRRLWAAAGFLVCAALMVYTRFYFGYVVLALSALPLLARLWPWAAAGPRPAWSSLALTLALGILAFALTKPWHQEYFVYFERGEILPRSQFEAKSRKDEVYKEFARRAELDPGFVAPQPPPPPVPPQGLTGLWEELNTYRQRFQRFAGRSLAPDADASPLGGLARALRDSLLFPYPWQRWPANERWTAFNLAVSAQGVLWYALLLGILPGVAAQARRRPDIALPLALWGLGLGLLLAFVVLNRGTLFRLRDMAMMPLVLFWGLGWPWRRRQSPPAAPDNP